MHHTRPPRLQNGWSPINYMNAHSDHQITIFKALLLLGLTKSCETFIAIIVVGNAHLPLGLLASFLHNLLCDGHVGTSYLENRMCSESHL